MPVPDTTPEIFRSIEPRALITRRSVRERLQGFSGGGGGGGRAKRWKFRGVSTVRGSFRLFQQQPPGCRYHRNFPWRGQTASVQPISTPHYPSAVISPFATIPRRIRNRRLQRFRSAGRFIRFHGRPRNVIQLHRNRTVG